jgi:hypothetical protein
VAIDPGQTTGLVAFTVLDNTLNLVDSYELDLVGIGNYLQERPYDIVAFEVANKFQVSGHMSSEVIGLAKYFGLTRGARIESVLQASHKRLITREVLQRAGMNVKGGHAKDAAGVGLFAVVNLKLMDDLWFLRKEG